MESIPFVGLSNENAVTHETVFAETTLLSIRAQLQRTLSEAPVSLAQRSFIVRIDECNLFSSEPQ